ncbi:MAG: RNA ligase family protein [Ruminococcus sp.]|nr:RNA ligase family protein [Ruminococcus sp.]
MQTYHKIDTVFLRDTDGTKKLIDGSYRDETIKFLAETVKWQFTEKIDGTNIRIHWDGYRISFAGRTEKSVIPPHLMEKLKEIFLKSEVEELFEQTFGEKEVILFGEGYGAKIQGVGNQYRNDVGFILFDVIINGNWQSRENVGKIAECFGLEVVPVVLTDTINQAVEFVKSNPKSTIGTAYMEGVVGRPEVELQDRTGKRIIVKIKSRDFNMK